MKVNIDFWYGLARTLELTGIVRSPSGEITIFNREARERGFLWVKATELLGASDDGRANDMTARQAVELLLKLSAPVE